MLRVSVTMLESFRRVVQTEYGDENSLIAQVKGQPFEPSWQMRAGSAWHTCLEKEILPEIDDKTRCGLFSFKTDAVQAGKQHIGNGIWEVKASRVWNNVEVVAKADHCHGLFLQDNKTKFSTADARDYERSLQWRYYLLIHGATCFRYNLFSFNDPKGIEGYCELREINSFRFWPYSELESDCEFWVREFILWCQGLGLTKYLERASSTPELGV